LGAKYNLPQIAAITGVHEFLVPAPYGNYPAGLTDAVCRISHKLCKELAEIVSGMDSDVDDSFNAHKLYKHNLNVN